MTEERWLAEIDPWHMVTGAPDSAKRHRTKAGRRRYRLFGVACCRRVWNFFEAVRKCAALVEMAERLADGMTTAKAVEPLLAEVPFRGEYGFDACLAAAARYVASPNATNAAGRTAMMVTDLVAHAQSPSDSYEHVRIAFVERAQQVKLVHCLYGNPFRAVTVDPAWLTSTVITLARGIYDDRAFDRLPILADALQDAGCDNADVLNHCRDAGPHARGCWVVDLVLGKA